MHGSDLGYFFIIRYTRDRAIELFETFEHRAERFPTISMITFTIAVQTFAVSRLLEAFRWMKKLEIFFLKLNSLQIERRINNNFEEIKKKKKYGIEFN